MQKYTVSLFAAPGCVRGWLAYLKSTTERETLLVEVDAETGASAKNKAITAANNGFKGLKIIKKNYDDKLWGLNNFPQIKQAVELAAKGEGEKNE